MPNSCISVDGDVRSVIREDLHRLIGESFATIGVSSYSPHFYTVMPAVEPLKSENPGQKADFFLMGLSEQFDSTWLNAIIRRVETQGAYRYEKTYIVRPKIFGRELQLARFPQDMTYPFPIIFFSGVKVET